MNSQIKAKLLQQLAKNKKNNKGFTLIELLVVVIIVGILAAVALPNLLGQVGKARETEGKNGVGTINRAQQAYHFEKQSFAAPALNNAALGSQTNLLGVVVASSYYTFDTTDGDDTFVQETATPTAAVNDGTRFYAGGVGYAAGQYNNIVCQEDSINSGVATTITPAAAPVCPASTTSLE